MSVLDTPASQRAGRARSKLPPRMWDAAETPLVCTAVRDEAPLVKTFRLAPEDGSRVKFHAGQNLTLEWALPSGEVCRPSFTIASPPTDRDGVELTVKAQADGRVTKDLHARLVPGMALRAFGPGGRFCLAHHPADKVLLIGAGTGATPMMSMLRWVRARRYETDIAYLHCASTPADVLFAEELMAIVAECPNVAVTVIVSRVPPGAAWLGPRGRLGRKLIAALVPDARLRETFLCGPEGFRQTVRRALRAEGAEAERIHEETFAARPPVPPPLTRVPADGWSLSLARSGRRIDLDPQKTLYANMRSAGLVVPTGCRSGICGTCKTRALGGSVAMVHQGGLSREEEAAGLILPCCSYATGDVALDA